MTELSPRYAPADVESRWFAAWTAAGAFKPEVRSAEATPHVIMIPPPNVTGALHMGHALNNTLQDVMTRFRRMQGFAALWVPGTDHAGIATQNVVEKAIAKEGKTRDSLGRDAFIERVWAWKEQYGGRIIDQLKRLGCSCDWDRERFTMDDGLSRAVTEAFVRLHEKGLIYQGERLINWCTRCLTALSDEEAEAVPENGGFWHLRYRVEGEPGRFVVVATTRPETLFADSAVAVHPDDPRYRDLVGRRVLLPVIDRAIPVIADPHADPEKGSGAVKITPAHDFNDFAVGERHGLSRPKAMDERGRMTDAAGPFAGLDRFEARKKLVAHLEEIGLLEKHEQKEIPLPRCYRCTAVVEPRLSKQWFVKMRPLLEPAAEAVRDGRVKIIPERYTRTYLDWVEQFRDWCISRQIWWGHRIPAWHSNKGNTVVSAERPADVGDETWARDPDVLDTWFSSQLWPFSTLGWPDATPDLKRFYPTDVLVTARDIIYFWVARMVMCGLEFMGEVPFRRVYITGTVLDEQGRRMSKSLGNGIDPIDMIDRYGCDAVRWSLVMLAAEGQDIKLGESRFEGGRNFINKLWNAARFTMMNVEDWDGTRPSAPTFAEDRWLRSRLHATIADVTASLDRLAFGDAAKTAYEFTWNTFCDWYLELAKSRLQDKSPEGAASRRAAQALLVETLDTILRLIHPIAPFVTEEIRERLRDKVPGASVLLATESWPVADASARDADAEGEVGLLIEIVGALRSVRDDLKVPFRTPIRAVLRPCDAAMAKRVAAVQERAKALVNLGSVESAPGIAKPPASVTKVVPGLEVFVPTEGLVDLDAERARLTKQVEELKTYIASKRGKLANEGFVSRAKPEVVAKEREQLADAEARLSALETNLADLG